MNLCDRLKEERERLGHSQTAFAALAGASKHSQINWEKGVASPNAAALAAWAEAGLDVLYVVTGHRAQPIAATDKLTSRQRALLSNYEHTSEEGKRIIEGTADLAAKSAAATRGSKAA